MMNAQASASVRGERHDPPQQEPGAQTRSARKGTQEVDVRRETLSRAELEKYLGVDERTLARMRHQEGFPQPHSLTNTKQGMLRWYKDEVDAWLNNRPAIAA